MHKASCLLRRREALVHELEVVVEESLVAAQVVLLSSEELVDLGQPGSIQGLAIWLRSVMDVELVGEVFVGDVHVL